MEEKYYTPQIEEFRMGFEYEWKKEDGTWEKATPIEISELNYKEQLYGLRVKYLDANDIESCGFKFTEGFDAGKTNWFKKDFYELLWYPTGLGDEGNITIYEFNIPKFDGTIKNKSELIQILKMIGVE